MRQTNTVLNGGEEVVLTGMLAEFRTALQEEIEAARRNASGNAVMLINGRRIAQVGSGYQYIFTLENVLNMPGDSPGDLYVQGCLPQEVVIISVEGMAITLSVPNDLGAFVPNARLQSNLAYLMRKLIERIEAKANIRNLVGDKVLGIEHPSGKPTKIEISGLHDEQMEAVASCLGRDITFLCGPPGTGKTHTIGAMATQLYQKDRSVLLVSHTNNAVDQALIKIGEALKNSDPAALTRGLVLRVGDPHDLRINQWPDLLLSEHVKHRSAALVERKESLYSEKELAIDETKRISRDIDICEWVELAEADLDRIENDLTYVQRLESNLEAARIRLAQLEETTSYWNEAKQSAQEALRNISELKDIEKQVVQLYRSQEMYQKELYETISYLREEKEILSQVEEIEPLRARAKLLPSLFNQTETVKSTRVELNLAKNNYDEIVCQLFEATALYSKTSSVGTLTRLWQRLPSPEEQREKAEMLRLKAASALKRLEEYQKAISVAEELLNAIDKLTEILRPYASLPKIETQQYTCSNLEIKIAKLQSDLYNLKQKLDDFDTCKNKLSEEIKDYYSSYSISPEEIIRQAHSFNENKNEIRSRIKMLFEESSSRRREITQELDRRITALKDWGLVHETAKSAETISDLIKGVYISAKTYTENLVLSVLKDESRRLNERIKAIESEVDKINEQLQHVEDILISEAMIIGTTLTRAYLRDTIQSRRFDTVILDEASMAPIPALWLVAGLAENNAVVVGDFKQLPPIVMSSHDLSLKWLGKDIFEVAGLDNTENPPAHMVRLKWQRRMHPDICAISNKLVYDDYLADHEDTYGPGSDDKLKEWYNSNWGHDNPVLLVDTGSVGAWVTSVPRGPRSSRLNFLSATICIDLAELLLYKDRSALDEVEQHHILIVSPYRPHAQLLQLLLREQNLDNDVRAGTVHSFQGSEADVVIVDLVNDEPHWRVAMFMPAYDKNIKRLSNVAFTRARRRLIIVGDFDYIIKNSRKAFIGGKLIPYLKEHYPCVDVLQIIPAGLSAKAAKAQSMVIGGSVEPDASRIIVTQDNFYSLLYYDLEQARDRVILYSAFITQERLGQIGPHLKAAIERGVCIYVVTKARGERQKGEISRYQMLEQALEDWGIVVIHKRGMHEKLIFIDEDVLWSGSLNPLSFSDTQEIMERRVSREVVTNFARTLRLEDLIGEYHNGQPKCPYCDNEVVASEGADQPFYWRCIEDDCYARSIDKPPIKGGIIVCANCGGDVEYGEWGGKHAWRCRENPRHHQKLARTHLRLPKMRELIPKNILRELDKKFDTAASKSQAKLTNAQGKLF